MFDRTDVQASLPLTETVFLILLSLAPGPKHGYAILKDVAALSEERVQLSTGTLYGGLKRLLAQGWIQRCVTEPATTGPGRPRQDYALTDLGRRILEAEVARFRSLVAVADLRTSEGPA